MSRQFRALVDSRGHLGYNDAESEEFLVRPLADPDATIRARMENGQGIALADGFRVEVHEASATVARLAMPPRLRSPSWMYAPSLAIVSSTAAIPAPDQTYRLSRHQDRA